MLKKKEVLQEKKPAGQYPLWTLMQKFSTNTSKPNLAALKGLYIMTNWDLFLECKDGSTY